VKSKKKILLAPLDWGLGHASRCIPIANQLIDHGFEVIFAASGRPMHLLMNDFPKHDFIKLEGYHIHYPKNGQMAYSMMTQSLKIWQGIRREHSLLQSIIDTYQIDGVISDNRYGLYSTKVPCVFITHQLNIQAPILSSFIRKINHKYINRFSQCWIPDTPQHQLSGILSSPIPSNIDCKYVGSLSRFKKLKKTEDLDILAVISGPEPQRTVFEKLLRKELKKNSNKALLVLGKTEDHNVEHHQQLKIVGHLNSEELNQAMVNADIIISRSGYSTIMDIAMLHKKAIFVPTPGQTEQLYLAKYFYDQKMAYAMHQNQFDLDLALNDIKSFNGICIENESVNWTELFDIF